MQAVQNSKIKKKEKEIRSFEKNVLFLHCYEIKDISEPLSYLI